MIKVEDEYCLQVESHFAARRGTPFIFSAKDWALLQQWKDTGIPLPVVIEAIDQCFEKREKAGRRRVISSLRYCRHAVKELWEERKDLLVGSGTEAPEVDPYARLADMARTVAESAESASHPVRAELQAAAERLGQILRGKSVPQIEEQLIEIEQELMERLVGILPQVDRDSLEREIEQELAGYTAAPAVLEKTRQANLRRVIRKRLSLPRLSLFS